MEQLYKIGPLQFVLERPAELKVPVAFERFRVTATSQENSDKLWRYEISLTGKLPEFYAPFTAERDDLLVADTDAGEMRWLGIRGTGSFYACYEELSDESAKIQMLDSRTGDLWIDPVFNSLLALERRMISLDTLLLHCAYMEYQGQAILFSAPSGVGKSTQAGLWERYRGGRTVNGDRALIRRSGLYCDVGKNSNEQKGGMALSSWIAEGFPVCGSSEICHNESMPIRAIVMLGQSKENHIRRLRPMEAFREIFPQITVNNWNREFVTRVMEILEQLIVEVPVYQLDCDISEKAVVCLEDALSV